MMPGRDELNNVRRAMPLTQSRRWFNRFRILHGRLRKPNRFPMSVDVVCPLRQRMIEDMTARKLGAGTQRLHISSCKRFAAFLQRSPDAATVEDIRRFQLHLAETGTSIPNRNRIMTGLRGSCSA